MVVCDLTFLQAGRYEPSCSYYTLNIKRLKSINKQRKDFDDPSICKHVIPLNWRALQIENNVRSFQTQSRWQLFHRFCCLQHEGNAKPGFMTNTVNSFKIIFSHIYNPPKNKHICIYLLSVATYNAANNKHVLSATRKSEKAGMLLSAGSHRPDDLA